MIEERAYQSTAVDAIVTFAAEHPEGGSLLICCPPGGGKTVIVALSMNTLVAAQGLRAVAWAHRREIVCQNYDHLIACGVPRHLIGILLTGDAGHEQDNLSMPRRRTDLSAPIQVGTVGMIRKHRPPADMVWSDEAHLDASDGRRALRALYPTAFHLGTTGTPSRLDGRGLKREYGTFLPVSSVTELIALGYLADPIVWTVPDHLLPNAQERAEEARRLRHSGTWTRVEPSSNRGRHRRALEAPRRLVADVRFRCDPGSREAHYARVPGSWRPVGLRRWRNAVQ